MAFNGFLAVGAGAALGAWVRWGLGLVFGTSGFALGTFLANLIGGLLMGCALAYFASSLAQHEWRLFVMTGFLGGLTTFSAFSAESFLLIQRGQFWLATLHTGAHVLGALAMVGFGYFLIQAFR
jgi:fluoride exporter